MAAREQAWSHVDYASLPEVRLLQDYVRIDTSPITGSEVKGAEFLAEQLRRAGISPTIDLVDATHANLWAVIDGESPEALVLHNHLDVTSPGATEWDFPPFAGDIRGPWLRGRGTFDMKSVAIAQLLSFIDVKASGRRPPRSLIFLATSSEEHGSEAGMIRVLAQQPELVRRFSVMLTEGGAVETRSLDDIKYWGIEFAQRRYVHLTAVSATREPLVALEKTAVRSTKPRLCAETRAFLSAYSDSRDSGDFRSAFADPERWLADPKALEDVPPVVRELLSDDLFLQPIVPHPGGGYERGLGILLLPDSDWDAVRRELLPEGSLVGLQIQGEPTHGPAPGSPLDHPVYKAMARILDGVASGAPVGPYMLGHTLTDARFLRARGIPAYGFSPFLFLSVDTYRVDKRDEEIGLPGYVSGVKVYRDLIQNLMSDRSHWR